MELRIRKEILRNHALRITDCRLDVLDLFMERGHALSQKHLEDHYTEYDRVTLYRTLFTFVASGLLHRIPDDSGFASYGLCHNTCTPNEHHDDHLHFKCNDCGNIECLDEVKIPKIKVPEDYLIDGTQLIVKGLCSACRS